MSHRSLIQLPVSDKDCSRPELIVGMTRDQNLDEVGRQWFSGSTVSVPYRTVPHLLPAHWGPVLDILSRPIIPNPLISSIISRALLYRHDLSHWNFFPVHIPNERLFLNTILTKYLHISKNQIYSYQSSVQFAPEKISKLAHWALRSRR